jgi:hypothetical protein
MIKFQSAGVGEYNVVAADLRFNRQVVISEIQQYWKIGQIRRDLGMIDSNGLPELPVGIPPSSIGGMDRNQTPEGAYQHQDNNE